MASLYLAAMNWISERKECGQGLVEYVLIIGLIAILLVTALLLFKNELSMTFSNIQNALA